MVFGMFMSILDIQIVSASLNEIQAGLSASQSEVSWVQTSYLIAEVIAIPAVGLHVARARHAAVVCDLGFRLHHRELLLRLRLDARADDHLARDPGISRRRHDPDRVRLGLLRCFRARKFYIVGPIIGLVATLAPTIGPTVGGIITDWMSWHWLFFINIVPGIGITVGVLILCDFDKPDFKLLEHFDWWGLLFMAALPRHARICAGGGAAI